MENQNTLKKILVVTAHPDDETFGMGGTIAKYISEGSQVFVVCATKGEAGEADPALLAQYESMAALREAEMRCAMQELGVQDVFFLGYRDSGMPGSAENVNSGAFIQAPLQETAQKIAFFIRKLQPQLLLTFDPMGGYGHPDHIYTYQSVVKALEISADGKYEMGDLYPFQPKGVYLHTFPRKMMRIVIKLMPLFGRDPTKFGKNGDIDFVKILQEDYPIHARIRYAKVANIREKAAACYRSQGGDSQSGYFLNWLLRFVNSSEVFIQYYPAPLGRGTKHDLFQGL
ncbi:MAG TPA: GlcNAc-PI de-N-acetylase [Anaerolineaceae bacterium]|uniref:Putative deacetylase n=1 Tax=Anaerolinea thermophila TaxID=167964 RepID=A0A101FYP8_9CHLR|nr:MAG: Putative deacetylase [Anaerolinea thermophila]HAF61842.1 GlcNAc-PI de-N-acetylase [Anaerolineaceae bacterium]